MDNRAERFKLRVHRFLSVHTHTHTYTSLFPRSPLRVKPLSFLLTQVRRLNVFEIIRPPRSLGEHLVTIHQVCDHVGRPSKPRIPLTAARGSFDRQKCYVICAPSLPPNWSHDFRFGRNSDRVSPRRYIFEYPPSFLRFFFFFFFVQSREHLFVRARSLKTLS